MGSSNIRFSYSMLEKLFKYWSLNRNVFAAHIGMPKGTFNNKLNSNHKSQFNDEEKKKIIHQLRDLRKSIDLTLKEIDN